MIAKWENGYCEKFNGTLREAPVVIEQWRQHYNRVRPHSALGYRSPAPEARGLALVPRQSVPHLKGGVN